MKTLFESATVVEIMERLSVLRPESERVWGKMNAAQALAHCSAVMEMAVGDAYPPRLLVGRLLGPLLKPIYSNEKPLKRGSPTDKSFIVRGQRDFAIEKERLSNLIQRFFEGGAEGCTKHPHCFFGRFTPAEWATGMYKHLDHHLQQFGA
jgi:hypothetical protein